MSKMDGLRAMREARYAEAMKRAAAGGAKPTAKAPVAPDDSAAPAARGRAAAKKTTATKSTAKKTTAKKADGAKKASEAKATTSPEAGTDAEELCGHRNMGGKSCTREKGHAAKSHRYS